MKKIIFFIITNLFLPSSALSTLRAFPRLLHRIPARNLSTELAECNTRLLLQKIESNKLQREFVEIKRAQFCLDYLRTTEQYPQLCNYQVTEECKKYLATFTLPNKK